MMQFESLAEFVAMGGHGLYVWLAYGATLLVLASSTVALQVARRKQLQQLRWTLQGSADAPVVERDTPVSGEEASGT